MVAQSQLGRQVLLRGNILDAPETRTATSSREGLFVVRLGPVPAWVELSGQNAPRVLARCQMPYPWSPHSQKQRDAGGGGEGMSGMVPASLGFPVALCLVSLTVNLSVERAA